MVNPPAVTVICPTYNRRHHLRCALRSVLNQDFTGFEVRVIGDGCNDGSEEVISELNDPRVHWFNLPANSGTQTAPNNEGLRQARGKYVAFIGHDDLWLPWHLSRLVQKIHESGADFVHDITVNLDPKGVESVSAAPLPRAGYARIYVPTSSWLHRRDLADSIGGWRHLKDLSWPIDFDFSRRAALAGKKFAFQPSLGVLKFHSQTWKSYAQQGEPAQERWLRSILQSPAEVTEKLLCEAAAQYALDFQLEERIPFGVARDHAVIAGKRAGRALLREMNLWYGPERWPVGPFLRWRFQKKHAQNRKLRGLPPFRAEQL
jgi:glycosyltransferase involved in cell wall biosynthesis